MTNPLGSRCRTCLEHWGIQQRPFPQQKNTSPPTVLQIRAVSSLTLACPECRGPSCERHCLFEDTVSQRFLLPLKQTRISVGALSSRVLSSVCSSRSASRNCTQHFALRLPDLSHMHACGGQMRGLYRWIQR